MNPEVPLRSIDKPEKVYAHLQKQTNLHQESIDHHTSNPHRDLSQ